MPFLFHLKDLSNKLKLILLYTDTLKCHSLLLIVVIGLSGVQFGL